LEAAAQEETKQQQPAEKKHFAIEKVKSMHWKKQKKVVVGKKVGNILVKQQLDTSKTIVDIDPKMASFRSERLNRAAHKRISGLLNHLSLTQSCLQLSHRHNYSFL
jgi:hypothetical protein